MKRLLGTALAVFFALATAAQSAGLYPLSNYQPLDANSKVIAGAKLYLFDGGTTTPRIGYKDSSLTSPHSNPILADANGRLPLIYLDDGFYRQRLTTKTGVQIFDQDGLPVLSSTSGGSGTSVDPDSVYKTGDFKVRFDNQPLAGFVRANGRTIGSASSGATERANIDTQPLYEWLWQFSNISVVGGKGASASADFAANKPLTLPDLAGRGLVGMDDLGAGAKNVINTLGATNVVGFAGGIQAQSIAVAQLPAYVLTGTAGGAISVSGTTGSQNANHAHAFSGTTGDDFPDHNHTQSGIVGTQTFNVGGPLDRTVPVTLVNSPVTGGANQRHVHNFAGGTGVENAVHQHAFTGNGTASLSASINSGGSGTAFNLMNPIFTAMIYLRL
jgi:hypothetical protein